MASSTSIRTFRTVPYRTKLSRSQLWQCTGDVVDGAAPPASRCAGTRRDHRCAPPAGTGSPAGVAPPGPAARPPRAPPERRRERVPPTPAASAPRSRRGSPPGSARTSLVRVLRPQRLPDDLDDVPVGVAGREVDADHLEELADLLDRRLVQRRQPRLLDRDAARLVQAGLPAPRSPSCSRTSCCRRRAPHRADRRGSPPGGTRPGRNAASSWSAPVRCRCRAWRTAASASTPPGSSRTPLCGCVPASTARPSRPGRPTPNGGDARTPRTPPRSWVEDLQPEQQRAPLPTRRRHALRQRPRAYIGAGPALEEPPVGVAARLLQDVRDLPAADHANDRGLVQGALGSDRTFSSVSMWASLASSSPSVADDDRSVSRTSASTGMRRPGPAAPTSPAGRSPRGCRCW